VVVRPGVKAAAQARRVRIVPAKITPPKK